MRTLVETEILKRCVYYQKDHTLKHHLVQAHRIVRPVIELRRPGTLMRGHHLRLLEDPAVRQINGDPGRPEAVAADPCREPGCLRLECVGAGRWPPGELPSPTDGTPEQR